MALVKTTEIKDFSGRIIAYIDIYSNGDKWVRSFSNEILGKYIKATDITSDFQNNIVAFGDNVGLLINK